MKFNEHHHLPPAEQINVAQILIVATADIISSECGIMGRKQESDYQGQVENHPTDEALT